MTAKPYRPHDLPEYRNSAVANDQLWQFVSMTRGMVLKHTEDFAHPELMRRMLGQAALWWIGADASELVEHAAPSMPPATLTPELMPDEVGFVCFERPITGVDADHEGMAIEVDCILWERGTVVGHDAVSIIAWRHSDDAGAPIPLGRADWIVGTDTDHRLDGLTDAQHASIVEDRRVLAALWQLSSQASIADTTEAEPDRATQRRLARRGHEVPTVRIVNLASHQRPHSAPSGDAEASREYRRRWIVGGHWRQQACGPQWSQRRPVYIAPHIKGPEDKPLVTPEPVKVWR